VVYITDFWTGRQGWTRGKVGHSTPQFCQNRRVQKKGTSSVGDDLTHLRKRVRRAERVQYSVSKNREEGGLWGTDVTCDSNLL